MTPGDMFLYMNIRKTPDLLATVKVGLIKKSISSCVTWSYVVSSTVDMILLPFPIRTGKNRFRGP